nr:MAG TPA: hypothetical protein [Caudoviricetes sp.]
MKAIKDNKEYTVTNESKQHYIDTGFDIVDDNGDIIEYGRGKTVSLEDHNKALERIKELEVKLKASAKQESKTDKEEEKPEKEGKK